MGYRVKLRIGKRILYSHSYPSIAKAKKASRRMRGSIGVVKS